MPWNAGLAPDPYLIEHNPVRVILNHPYFLAFWKRNPLDRASPPIRQDSSATHLLKHFRTRRYAPSFFPAVYDGLTFISRLPKRCSTTASGNIFSRYGCASEGEEEWSLKLSFVRNAGISRKIRLSVINVALFFINTKKNPRCRVPLPSILGAPPVPQRRPQTISLWGN